MTNPAGDVFISYEHSQQNLAEKLEIALRNHGIPVWRDVHDVGLDPLEQQIREDLQDSNLAGDVAIINSDVTQSPVILKTELPELHKRWRGDDEFFVVVVLAPGVDYDEAETILSKAESPYDLSHWYMKSLEVEETSSSSSVIGRIINSILDRLGQNQKTSSQLPPLDAVVDAVLERRLQCIHNHLSSNFPVECSLDTYGKPSHDIQLAVSIDWSPHFDEGIPDPRGDREPRFTRRHGTGRTVRRHRRAEEPAGEVVRGLSLRPSLLPTPERTTRGRVSGRSIPPSVGASLPWPYGVWNPLVPLETGYRRPEGDYLTERRLTHRTFRIHRYAICITEQPLESTLLPGFISLLSRRVCSHGGFSHRSDAVD